MTRIALVRIVSRNKKQTQNTQEFENFGIMSNGGELRATEVRNARRFGSGILEQDEARGMSAVLVSSSTGLANEPIKVRWVDTLKTSGIHMGRLVAKEFRRGSKN